MKIRNRGTLPLANQGFLEMGIFDMYGIAVSSHDMRALSSEEIQKIQYANMSAMQQAAVQPNLYDALRNISLWPMPQEKPLDERFADFKLRLAAALAKYSLNSA